MVRGAVVGCSGAEGSKLEGSAEGSAAEDRGGDAAGADGEQGEHGDEALLGT